MYLAKTLLQLGKIEEAEHLITKAQFDGVNVSELLEYKVIETLLLVEGGDYKKAHVNFSSGGKSRAASSFFHFLAK